MSQEIASETSTPNDQSGAAGLKKPTPKRIVVMTLVNGVLAGLLAAVYATVLVRAGLSEADTAVAGLVGALGGIICTIMLAVISGRTSDVGPVLIPILLSPWASSVPLRLLFIAALGFAYAGWARIVLWLAGRFGPKR